MEQEKSYKQQLEELRKEYEEFTYIISHDLKAPLRAISNLSEWIKEDLGDQLEADVAHNIQLLQNRTTRLQGMINGILAFSRISRYDLEPGTVNVKTLVQAVAASLQKSHPFEVHVGNLPTLTTYSKKLETVFHHLLQNSVVFNENGKPEVWVEAVEQDNFILFTVRDNGIGIPSEALEKVFRMFYTVQSKDNQPNVGVGLTICRKIVEHVGGSISLQSVVGEGTVISFTWPKEV